MLYLSMSLHSAVPRLAPLASALLMLFASFQSFKAPQHSTFSLGSPTKRKMSEAQQLRRARGKEAKDGTGLDSEPELEGSPAAGTRSEKKKKKQEQEAAAAAARAEEKEAQANARAARSTKRSIHRE